MLCICRSIFLCSIKCNTSIETPHKHYIDSCYGKNSYTYGAGVLQINPDSLGQVWFGLIHYSAFSAARAM